MWLSTVLVLSASLLPFSQAVDDINAVCNGVGGVVGCAGTFDVPTGATKKMCTSGGTTKQCGINVSTKKVNMCDAVRAALPGTAGTQFVAKAEANCVCFRTVLNLSDLESFWPIWFFGNISSTINFASASAAGHMDKCLIDNGFTITSGRNEVLQNELAPVDGYTVVKAADVDVATYVKLLAATRSCFTGTCDGAAMTSFFTSYFQASTGIGEGELAQMFSSWGNLLESMKKQVAEIQVTSKTLQSRLTTVSNKVAAVKKDACQGNACTGPLASSFFTKISQALDAVKLLSDVTRKTEANTKSIQNMINTTYTAVRYTRAIPEAQYIGNLIQTGQISAVSDILKAWKITSLLPTLEKQYRAEMPEVLSLVGSKQTAQSAAAKVDEVILKDWTKQPELWKTASAKKVRDGFFAIQSSFKTDLKDPLDKLVKQLQNLDQSYDNFPFREHVLQWGFGAAPYSRFHTSSMQVPCRTMKKQVYNLGGFQRTYEYPSYYACPFGPKTVGLQVHHIPWLKFRFV